jgi:hypothetical protein
LQAATAAGYGGSSYEDMLEKARVPQGAIDYFVELHIEQVCVRSVTKCIQGKCEKV